MPRATVYGSGPARRFGGKSQADLVDRLRFAICMVRSWILAAQYESWSLPVMMAVPFA